MDARQPAACIYVGKETGVFVPGESDRVGDAVGGDATGVSGDAGV